MLLEYISTSGLCEVRTIEIPLINRDKRYRDSLDRFYNLYNRDIVKVEKLVVINSSIFDRLTERSIETIARELFDISFLHHLMVTEKRDYHEILRRMMKYFLIEPKMFNLLDYEVRKSRELYIVLNMFEDRRYCREGYSHHYYSHYADVPNKFRDEFN